MLNGHLPPRAAWLAPSLPFRSMRLRQLLLPLLGVLAALPARTVHAQEPTSIRLLRTASQSFMNTQVTVVGEVRNVEINSAPGLAKVTFRVIDDSDDLGILVRTSGTPPQTGKVFRITGVVGTSQLNASELELTESDRSEVRPAWMPWVIGGGVAMALFLGVMLVRSLRSEDSPMPAPQPSPWPSPAPAPAPWPAPPPMPVVPPMPAPTPMPAPPIIPPSPASTPTPTPAPRTEPFVPLPKPGTTQPFVPTGASVEVVEGEDRPREVPIGTAEFMIGRSGGRSNHLTLANSTVSQTHATIKMDAATGKFFLLNESRTNKARVNGEAVEMAPLSDGSRIELGAVSLLFHQR